MNLIDVEAYYQRSPTTPIDYNANGQRNEKKI